MMGQLMVRNPPHCRVGTYRFSDAGLLRQDYGYVV